MSKARTIADRIFASQTEAETGTDTSKLMNALRAKQAITFNKDVDEVFLRAYITSTGVISWSTGLTSISRPATGTLILNFPARATSEYSVLTMHAGTGEVTYALASRSLGSCDIRCLASAVPTHLNTYVTIIGARP